MKYLFVFLTVFGMSIVSAQAQTVLPPECAVYNNAAKQAPNNHSAEYVPGVDVNGNAVAPAPADLNGAPATAETLVVPVTIDLAQRTGLPVNGMEMSATLGFLEISPGGRVIYNGQDLTQKVNDACAGKPPENVAEPAPQPDRQKQPDVIEYAPVTDTKPAPIPLKAPEPEKAQVPQGELIEGGEYKD